MSRTNAFNLTFRGEPVRRGHSRKVTIESVYPTLFVVLTYPKSREGKVAMMPIIEASYATKISAERCIKNDPTHLQQWPDQSFVVGPIKPGTTEITEIGA